MTAPQVESFTFLKSSADVNMFLEKRMENDGSGNPLYIGYTNIANASTASACWFIVKITYTTGFPTYVQLPRSGAQFTYSWDNRATYF